MIQNYDKVVKYDNEISYFNIEIHKACHMQHLYYIKMVKFGNTMIIFNTSKKNQTEIKDLLVQNFSLLKRRMGFLLKDKDVIMEQVESSDYESSPNPKGTEDRDTVEPLL